MARYLDPGRSFGEHVGPSHRHKYQQHQSGTEFYFDEHGRECDPHTGELMDPNQPPLAAHEIQGKPAPLADRDDVRDLKEIVKQQQQQLEAMQRMLMQQAQPVDRPTTKQDPRPVGAMSYAQLKDYADEIGLPYKGNVSKEQLLSDIRAAESA